MMLLTPLVLTLALSTSPAGENLLLPYRTPETDAELRYWLQNMVWHHDFNDAEIMAATGLSLTQVTEARQRLDIHPHNKPPRDPDAPLLVLPYPGGRHPRIGFQDGAVWPQRETKVSVFAPWEGGGYLVVDAPEAIWSNLGLTYLAHTHVPTIWDQQGITLPPLEWNRRADGTCDITRTLPNGIAFTMKVIPGREAVRFQMTLHNGTDEQLTGLRIQMCAMLKAATGFADQTNDNKIFRDPYAAVRHEDDDRWIIFAWSPLHRVWGNPPCPCLHSDPIFPDLDPGRTGRITGWMSFYEGDDIEAELRRIEATGWSEE